MGLNRKLLLAALAGTFILSSGLPSKAWAQADLDSLRASLEDAATEEDSALPGGGDMARSPGLGLPSGPEASTGMSGAVNPFDQPKQAKPKTPEEIEQEIREKAFDAAITGLLPMNPDEIRVLLEKMDETQQAVEVPVYPYPGADVVVETVSLDPGSKPPVINVGVGHVTSLTILDVTGEPWPIKDLAFGGNFEVVSSGSGSHMIRITPLSEFAHGNVSVQLLNLKTPVTFTLSTQRDNIHYRFDARIPEYGPFAKVPIMQGGMTLVAGNSILSSVLDGIAPQGSEKMDVQGVDGRTTAYSYGETTYLRTPLTLLSPSWTSSVSSADGMNVYALSNAPVVLLSDRGNIVRASITEKGASDE